MLNVYDKAVGNNSLSTLWVLSLITAFLFVMMGSMEVLRSQVLSAIASKLDQLLTGTFYDYAFSHAVLVGPEKATTLPLVDINNLRQFLTGTGITAAFDARVDPNLFSSSISISPTTWMVRSAPPFCFSR